MNKRALRGAAALLTAGVLTLSLFGGLSLSVAAQEEPTVVRVGVYESNGFISLGEDGAMNGYGADFMERLAQYANFRYEYVRMTWSECMAGLLDGRIDIVTDARRTAERELLYDFSAQNIGQIQAAVFVRRDRENIYFNDYAAMDGLRVGFEADARNLELYEAFAAEHGFTAVTVEYPATSDLRRALEAGEIDAFGGDTHVYTDDLRVISIYNTDPNYIMAREGSPLMKRVNLAIEEMFSQNPDMIAEQYSYLTSRQVYGDILLTRGQAEYLRAHPVLRVATFADRRPASWFDEETQSFKGIAIEIMERLSALTGFDFEYVAADSSAAAAAMLARDDVDLAMPSTPAAFLDDASALRVTNPLYSLSAALAVTERSRRVDESGFTVAVARSNDGIRTMLENAFPGIAFRVCDTTADCISALQTGEVDAYGNAMYELEYQLKRPQNSDLSISYSYSCPIDYCVALRGDAPEELFCILNNGIALLPQEETEHITRYYSSLMDYTPTFADRLYESRFLLVGGGCVLLVLICAWLLYFRMQRSAMAAVKQKEEEARAAADGARRANATKSEFLSRMSHDMRTPMNGILGLAALSEDMEMSEQARDAMRKIAVSGKFLLSLINDTLDMNKIESGQLVLHEQPCGSREMMRETMGMIAEFAKERGVTCSIRYRNLEDEMLMMDKLRVQQIVLNIVSNAVKFSPVGGEVALLLEGCDRRDGVLYSKLSVTDHGIGMSRAFLPKIFLPFEQERDPTTGEHSGTGLGMSIAKRLVDLMGGQIAVESEQGVGTTVTVQLAFALCGEGTLARARLAQRDAALPRGLRVLLCEDNPINTLVARGFLEKAGCVVDCAGDGREGLRLFRESAPGDYAAVLMDIRMPVMDGIAAAEAIRALDRPDAATVPILALTANAFDEDREACLCAGMTAHVPKPIDARLLLSTLERAIRQAGRDAPGT